MSISHKLFQKPRFVIYIAEQRLKTETGKTQWENIELSGKEILQNKPFKTIEPINSKTFDPVLPDLTGCIMLYMQSSTVLKVAESKL